MGAIHIDRFSVADHLPKRTRTYDAVKTVILEAGRFSTFEASDDPGLFSQLLRDPEIEAVPMGYPWIGVRRRSRADGTPRRAPGGEP